VGSGKLSAKVVLEHIPSLKDLAAKQEAENIEEKISEIESYSNKMASNVRKKLTPTMLLSSMA